MRRWMLAVALAGLVLSAGQALALMKGLTTEELTRESDVVVQGRVMAVRSYWNADHTRILSGATIAVSEVIRGAAPGATLTVEYEGGEVGDVGLKVSDMQPLAGGEEVILFLAGGGSSAGSGVHSLVGRSQGKYAVGQDGVARKSGFSVVPGAAVDYSIGVDELKAKIRSVR